MSDKAAIEDTQAPINGAVVVAPPRTAAIHNPAGGSYLSADIVKPKLVAAGWPSAHIDSILWLLEYGRKMKASQGRLAEVIGIDQTVISRLFNGNYPGDVQKQIDKIDHHRRLLAQEITGEARPICQTWVLTEIDALCAMARKAQTMAILTGRSHVGKTVALQEHTRRNNHGLTVYTTMPPGGAPSLFTAALARSSGISPKNSIANLRDRFIAHFSPGMLLIIDQVHLALTGRKPQFQTLEIIRDIHDLTGCSVVLCGTPIFADAFKDKTIEKFMEQFDNRVAINRRLPDAAPWGDVEMILNAYGLPPASADRLDARHHKSPLEIVQALVGQRGLGKLTKFLLLARAAATKRGEVFAWRHVVGTDAMLAGWARGDGPQGQIGNGKGGLN